MADLRLRIATPTDRKAVEQILLHSYPLQLRDAYAPALLTRALPHMTRANAALLASGTYYLVEEKGVPVGCGGWAHEAPGTAERADGLAHIRHVAVRADRGRRGVGRMLMEASEAAAVAAGAERLDALATLNARTFYERLGFTLVAPVDVTFPGDTIFPSLHMHKRLG